MSEDTGTATARVALTPEAADELRRLRAVHGPLLFHQSGRCCDGSSPTCHPGEPGGSADLFGALPWPRERPKGPISGTFAR